jgi:uncharacterized protein (DUF2384 family)
MEEFLTTNYERLREQAWRTFRNLDRADVWMRSVSPALDGRRPIQACENQVGYMRCCRVLDRIAAEIRRK